MKGSVLSINVVDARNLIPHGKSHVNARVDVEIEGYKQRTQAISTSGDPVWNEVMSFDISKGEGVIDLKVVDRDSPEPPIGSCKIPLDFLSEDNDVDQMKKERLCPLDNGKSQVRVAIQWIYSKVKLLKDIQSELQEQIDADKNYLMEASENLESMKQPFGGNFIIKAAENIAKEQGNEELAEAFGKISKEEDDVNEQVEQFL